MLEPHMADKIVRACDLIAEDAEKDARLLGGMRLTGYSVGTNFGQVYASLATLAKMLKEVTEAARG